MIQQEMSPKMLKVFKQKLVETMSAFIKFCAENDITYFATGGTRGWSVLKCYVTLHNTSAWYNFKLLNV